MKDEFLHKLREREGHNSCRCVSCRRYGKLGVYMKRLFSKGARKAMKLALRKEEKE